MRINKPEDIFLGTFRRRFLARNRRDIGTARQSRTRVPRNVSSGLFSNNVSEYDRNNSASFLANLHGDYMWIAKIVIQCLY